jgi:uncharacterized protein YciI
MNHYLLVYELADDYLARRGEFRGVHLKLAWAASERGELIMGGAVGDPVDQAMLMFKGDGPGAAEDFAKTDPYVKNGLVKHWRVRQWMTVVGDLADRETPVVNSNWWRPSPS